MKEFVNEKNSKLYLQTNFETRREIAESFTFNAKKFEPRTNEEFKFNKIQNQKKFDEQIKQKKIRIKTKENQ